MKACHRCGEAWTRQGQPGFKEACPKCMSYLHACVNCRLYNPSADRCSSITAECTGARDGLNYCEEFQFRDVPNNAGHRNGNHGNGRTTSAATRPRRGLASRPNGTRGPGGRVPGGAFDVSAGEPGGNADAARKKFDDLFGK